MARNFVNSIHLLLCLTPRPGSPHSAPVTATPQTPLQQTVRWLAAHTGFPARRLPEKAELLVLIATAAATEERATAAATPANVTSLKNKTFAAQMRNYTAMRRRAHINSDNSAKT